MEKVFILGKDRILHRILRKVRPAFVTSWLKRMFNVKRTVIETRYGRFFIDPVSQLGAAVICNGEYECEMRRVLEHFLKPSGTFVDVGANEGYFSVLAAGLVGSSGKVVAVEPQLRLKTVLEKNFEINNVQGVQIVYTAISDKKGLAKLYLSPDANTGLTALHQPTVYRLPTVTISTITLDELFSIAQIEQADLVKMDIEGFEYEAIIGSLELFKQRRIKAIALELHPDAIIKRGLDPLEITRLLDNCGYEPLQEFSNTVWTIKTT